MRHNSQLLPNLEASIVSCATRDQRTLAIVGAFDGTHIGGSFARAAAQLGMETMRFDVMNASRGHALLRAAKWHLCGRRPLQLERFSEEIVAACTARRPSVLIATGAAALVREDVCALRTMGIVCVNYSTDDPWNPAHRASWHLNTLPAYDIVFTTRRANIDDFHKLGCRDVRHLPFGYDDALFVISGNDADVPSHDVLFVGGADRDRVAFATAFMRESLPLTLVGAYWERYSATRQFTLGCKSPEEVKALTCAAKVNIALVRRANRDGHVMRSFEIGAIGGCMLTEDTDEHRSIFGPDGELVVYFRSPADAAARAKVLIADSATRSRLAASLHNRIAQGAHSYGDRLIAMLGCASERAGQGRAQR